MTTKTIFSGAVKKAVRLSSATPLTAISAGGRSFECIISTDEIDLSGDKVGQDWDLSVFQKNRKLLFNHQPEYPIGEVDWIEVREIPGTGNRRTFAGCTIFPGGVTEKGDETARLIACGGLGTVSVGFDCADATPLDPARPRGPLFYKTPRLMELSIVSLPCNTSAVITTKAFRFGNPDRAERMRRAAALVAKGARMQKGAERAAEALTLERQIAAAERLAGPHPTDGMSRAQRAAYAAAVVARGAPATPSASATGRELQNQNNAQHAALVGAHSMEQYPTKATRVIKAGLAARASRPTGFA